MYITYKNETQIIIPEVMHYMQTLGIQINNNTKEYVTIWDTESKESEEQHNIQKSKILFFKQRYKDMLDSNYTTSSHYFTFRIPKKSGGYRTISAPDPQLSEYLTDFANLLKDIGCLSHNAAYAYVKGRSHYKSLQVHQDNESKYFLKLDLKNFFTSFDKRFIMNCIKKIYPLCKFEELLSPCIDLCLLDGVLPQGSPVSPILTNILYVGIDYNIESLLSQNKFIYTRYADDILITHKESFSFNTVIKKLEDFIFKNTPFKINETKTRYGSINGSNWNLGLMLNKDNKITLGYKRKQRLRAAMFCFLNDFKNNKLWSQEDTYHLMGEYSYFSMIEPEYVNFIIQRLEQKTGVNYKQAYKQII